MSTVPPHSCIHYQNGTVSDACTICQIRGARARKLDGRHYRAQRILTGEDLDETQVIDQPAA